MDTFYLGCLYLLTGFTVINGATVSAGEDQITTFGDHPFILTCRYAIELDENPDGITIRHKRYRTSQFVDIFSFNVPANTSSYVEGTDLKNKAQLAMNENLVTVTYSSTDCNDNGTYQCSLTFGRNDVIAEINDEMQLTIESQPDPDMTQNKMDVFTEYEAVELVCSSYIRSRDDTIAWFGISVGNDPTDLTNLAYQSDPIQDNSGSRFCLFKRTSQLKVTLTREHNGMNFRCVVLSRDEQGQGELCDQSACTSSSAIAVQYGVRQEDLELRSDPIRAANTFDVGSSVTLTCDVDGNPEPYFKWVKERVLLIDEGSNWLTLGNLNLDDSGIYSCSGNNTVGETTYTVERSIGITVVSPPTTSITNPGNVGEVKTKETPQGLAMVTIIVIISAGVLLIIVIIIVVCCCCCRKGKEDKTSNNVHMNNMATGKRNPGFDNHDGKPTISIDGRAVENTYTLERLPSRVSNGPDVLQNTKTPDDKKYWNYSPDASDERYEPDPLDFSSTDLQFVAGPGALSRPRSRYPVVLDEYDADLYPPGYRDMDGYPPGYRDIDGYPPEHIDFDRNSGYLDVDRNPSGYVDLRGNRAEYLDVRRNSNDSGVNLDLGSPRPEMMFV